MYRMYCICIALYPTGNSLFAYLTPFSKVS
uniref:Uncharacterized protein n=1 Tax=Anguilla anguilla TaxID=7936 RepID=A0A0E9VIN0_ANGAN